jgi:hypothetical protein
VAFEAPRKKGAARDPLVTLTADAKESRHRAPSWHEGGRVLGESAKIKVARALLEHAGVMRSNRALKTLSPLLVCGLLNAAAYVQARGIDALLEHARLASSSPRSSPDLSVDGQDAQDPRGRQPIDDGSFVASNVVETSKGERAQPSSLGSMKRR